MYKKMYIQGVTNIIPFLTVANSILEWIMSRANGDFFYVKKRWAYTIQKDRDIPFSNY